MAAIVGALRAVLSLESASFTKGLSAAQKRLGDFDRQTRRLGGQIAKVGAGLSVASAGILVAVRGQLNAADEMSKAAQKFGVPIEALSKLKFAADLSGVSMESLGTSLGRLSREMQAAASGNGAAVQRFADLGVAVTDATGKLRPTEAVLADIADKFATLPDGAEKTATAIDIFGRSGADMIPLLNGGGAALASMAAEAESLGIVIDQKTGSAAEAFNDSITRLQGVMTGLVTQIVVDLAPTMQALAEKAVDLAKYFSDLSPATRKVVAVIGGLTIVIGPLLLGLGLLVASLGAVTGALAAMATAVLANPIIAAIAAIAAGAVLIIANWDSIAQFFTDLWATVTERATVAWENTKAAWADAGVFFAGALDGIKTAFADGWQRIKDLAAQWVDDFLQIGRDIVDGLKRGITEKWDAMIGWFQGKVDGLTGSIKSALGIESPSKVFRAIGQFITEGLSLGISDNVPMAESAIENLAGRLAGSAGSLTRGMDEFRSTAENAFESFVTGASSARQAASQLLASLASSAARSAFNGLFGTLFPSAAGNVFSGGRVQAFAAGGIVTKPTIFPMANGAGLMGEAGPEAIMPLTRIGGRLGVMAAGGGAQSISIDLRLSDDLDARIGSTAQGVAVRVARDTVSAYDRLALPRRIAQVSRDPRRVG